MGQRQLLTGFRPAILTLTYGAFVWGPFSRVLRVKSLWILTGDTLTTRTTIGLFYGPSADLVTGTPAASAMTPPGWTALHTPAFHPVSNNDDTTGFSFPFQGPSPTVPFILQDIDIDLTGDAFYLMCLVINRTAQGISAKVSICVETDPADATPFEVVPRPIPDGTPPPTPTPTTTPPPTPTPPPPPPPAPALAASLLPPANANTIRPTIIDPEHPIESSYELTK